MPMRVQRVSESHRRTEVSHRGSTTVREGALSEEASLQSTELISMRGG